MKKHTTFGFHYVSAHFDTIEDTSRNIILEHHERYDGFGYPNGKCEGEIGYLSRIVTVADIYDALTSKRPYRDAYSYAEGLEYVMANTGTMLDPEIAAAFSKKVAPYPIGTIVKLSSGWVGVVVKNYESLGLRPDILVIETGEAGLKPFEISLHKDLNYLNVTILGVVKFSSQEAS